MRTYFIISFLIILEALISSCSEKSYRIEFTELETGSSASLRGLHVVSDQVIWASGTGGTVMMTVDGGMSWKADTIPGASGDDFRSLHAWNEREAIVFGISRPGRAYYTDDGAETWSIVYENNSEGIFFDSAVFADEETGLALSDPLDRTLFVIRTTDGGRSWSELRGMPVLNDGEYYFAASNSCIDYHPDGRIWIITGGSAARVFISGDHGVSWEVRKTGLVHGGPSSGNFSVSFRDRHDGIIVGGTYDRPEENKNIAAFSSDGGYTWNLSDIMPREYRSCVLWLEEGNEKLAFAIGKTGCDYSADMGRTWIPGADVKDYYTARAVKGRLAGFAAGAGGKIARFAMREKD